MWQRHAGQTSSMEVVVPLVVIRVVRRGDPANAKRKVIVGGLHAPNDFFHVRTRSLEEKSFESR